MVIEPRNEAEQRIVARANLYMSQNDLLAPDLTVTIICAGTPQKVLSHYPSHIQFESLGGGYYRSRDQLPIHIVAINELEVTPKNYPLLMFATSKRKFVAFLRNAVGQDDSDDNPIITFAYFLKSDLIKELNMPLKNRLSKEALAFIIEDIGDEILPCFSADERLTGLSVEERVAGLSPEERRQLQRLLEQ